MLCHWTALNLKSKVSVVGSKLMDGGGGGGGAVDGGALPPLNWPRLGEEYQVDSTCIPICNVENQKKTSTLKRSHQ